MGYLGGVFSVIEVYHQFTESLLAWVWGVSGEKGEEGSEKGETAFSPKIASPLSPKEGLMLWLNLCEVWLESCNAPRRAQLRISAVQESVQSLVWSRNEMGSHWRDSNRTPNVDPFVCYGHLRGLISLEGGIFLRELELKLVVQTILSVLRRLF